jgi:FMN phosphatase YigB (HAD superfamily)
MGGVRLDDVRAVTFDFGNTLVPVGRAELRRAVALTADRVAVRLGPFDPQVFLRIWAEERERQFREEVPRMREVDLTDRLVRVVARLRGMNPPPAERSWDHEAARSLSDPNEIDWAVDIYSRAFVEAIPVPADVGPLLGRLAWRHVLGVLSNWPLAATVDRFVEHAGWAGYFRAIVVSQRVGTIKPSRVMFDVALRELRVDAAHALHVGDDWAADVVGAKQAGWRAAYLDNGTTDSPLPSSARRDDVAADAELSRLADIEAVLAV